MERAAGHSWKALLVLSFVGFQVLAHFILRDSLGVAAVSGLTHAVANLVLLWYFARTLRAGNEALVTRLARRVHGSLAPPLAAYTRRVTIAWCAFFAAQVAVSILLFAFAPLELWSMYVNLLSVPLIALMFAGELLYRRLRFPDHPRASIGRVIKAL
ncbi:MAG TPA: hypothetical protein VEU32_19110 [Burkholderiales bacterium]|nr:hypothetical protein [Burkholderiales bacterium]